MNVLVRQVANAVLAFPLTDALLTPFVYIAGHLLRTVRHIGFNRLPLSRKVLLQAGVLPVRRHYYEPLFDGRDLRKPLSAERHLPGIDLNTKAQLELLQQFDFKDELARIPEEKADEVTFYFNNKNFKYGDAVYWYSLIRAVRPRHIIEIGSGFSTKMACMAVRANRQQDAAYQCRHVCIEPYEMPWLEQLGVEVIREKVEETNIDLFGQLQENDIVFIDSSHIIRPQGDVLYELLELLPLLPPGVIVHIHDIFTPRDYPEDWVTGAIILWNEQYLLEAFLTQNPHWEVIGALNYLKNNHFEAFRAAFPQAMPHQEPGSFYIRRKA